MNRIKVISEAYDAYKRDEAGCDPRFLANSVSYLLEQLGKLSMNEYQQEAKTTIIYPRGAALDYTAMKLASEAGEYVGKMAKRWRDDQGKLTETRRLGLKAELGGVQWYTAICAYELGYTLEDIGRSNLAQLADRKKRGVLQGDGDER